MKFYTLNVFLDLTSKIVGLGPFDYTLYEESCGLEWKNWHRAFEWYLKANRIENDSDKFVKLIHLAGPKVQELYATLPVPPSVQQVPRGPLATGIVPHLSDYEMALAKLNEFFEPKKNSTYERHMFRVLKQEHGEKIGIFAMRLRVQAEKCEFGDSMEDNIKDQIIEKCVSAKLRRELLKLGDTNLDKILMTAKVFEAISEQSKTFDHGDVDKNGQSIHVNKIESKWNRKPNVTLTQIECNRCGFTGHRSNDDKCPARGKTCNKCNGRDHFSRKCRSKKRVRTFESKQTRQNEHDESKVGVKQESDEPTEKKSKPDDTVKMIESYQSNIKGDYIFCIDTNTALKSENEIDCKIGGVAVTATIDSGSKYNVIDVSDWEFLKSKLVNVSNQRTETDRTFTAYGGHTLTTVGIFSAVIETAHKQCVAEFYVVKDYGKILIGYDTAIPLGVLKMGENVNQIENTGALSKIKDFVVDIPIDKNVHPVSQPYRRVPVALEAAVDEKIEELLQKGIIEKVNEPSAWISPVVPVLKADDIRICIDMRRANEAVLRENHPLPTMEDFLPHLGKGKSFTKLDIKNAFHQV